MTNFLKRFDQLFLIFITFIFLVAIYWLYQKHTVGNDSTISEWLINYQGGFTRRGIIGEICFQLADFFNLSLRFVIFIFQSFLYLIYSILIYFFIKNVPKNILTIIAVLSPVFLLYPVAEIEVLARKEVFLYVGFISFLNLSSKKYSNNVPLIYIFFVFPILCLIWEPFIFFFLFVVYVIFIRNYKMPFKKIMLKTLLSFSSSILIIFLIFLTPMTVENHLLIVNSLMNKFNEICYMSCAALNYKSSISTQFIYVFDLISPEIIFRYMIVFLIAFTPLVILCLNTQLKNNIVFLRTKMNKFNNSKNILTTFIILLLPTLILFSSMTDWGRIINIAYTFSILTYIYLIKNNLVSVKKSRFMNNNFYLYKKKLFVFILIIFAFGWNQKTAMNGDISTNSLYKIIYNTSRSIIGFGSIRLFQDNPIIIFHKNYIE